MEIINLLVIWDSKQLRSMTTKRHQTDNANMAKIARKKKKKYGRCQVFEKFLKQTQTKMVISKLI